MSDPGNLNDNELLHKDTSYSPASETETEHMQSDPDPIAEDIDSDAVKVLPGTGGPDDGGDIELTDADPIYIPHKMPQKEA